MNSEIYVLIIVALTIAVVVLSLLLASMISQIRALRKQIRFIANNKTNQKVNVYTGIRQMRGMVNDLNHFIEATREEEIETMRKDGEIKNTIVNMSHDIRTPLTSLSGYFDLLLETNSEEDRKRYADIIKERISSLSDLLESMFFYTKLSCDSNPPVFDHCDVSQVMLTTLFSYYEDIERKGIKVSVNVAEGVELVTDEKFLKRILQNLIKNVLAHGKDEMRVSLVLEGKHAVMSVSNKFDINDEIDPSKVFDRFYQSDKTRNNNSSGIGLSVTQKLVHLINGKIKASVDVGWFTITISLDAGR